MKNNNLLDKYASKYFHMTVKALKCKKNLSVLKFFCFEDNITICGFKFIQKILIDQLEEDVLKTVKISSLKDGDLTTSKEPVMIIEGDYTDIALFEGIIDGILTRLSSITTNVKTVKNLIGKKNLIFMADRNDLYLNQPYDGYAAYVGGINKFVTKAMLEFIDQDGIEYVGTIPHSLIQQHHGNLINSLLTFHESFPNVKITALIDYNNDCVGEIIKLSKHPIKEHINAVRIDTSAALVDKSLQVGDWQNNNSLKGINHELVVNVREALDDNNLSDVKIIVSSSINPDKIEKFNKLKTPIDTYGIGSWFLTKNCHFTADLVKLNNQDEAKIGRIGLDQTQMARLKEWNWEKIRRQLC